MFQNINYMTYDVPLLKEKKNVIIGKSIETLSDLLLLENNQLESGARTWFTLENITRPHHQNITCIRLHQQFGPGPLTNLIQDIMNRIKMNICSSPSHASLKMYFLCLSWREDLMIQASIMACFDNCTEMSFLIHAGHEAKRVLRQCVIKKKKPLYQMRHFICNIFMLVHQ